MAYIVLDNTLAILFDKYVDYLTSIVPADGGEEDRNANWVNARRRWRLEVTRLTDEIAQRLEMHFHMVRGRWMTFLFEDPLDHDHWQVSTSTAATAIGTGDGATDEYQLIKLYGSGANTRNRPVTNPISGTVAIYLNGVLQTVTTDYTIDHDTGIVTFTSPPGDGVAITATFQFRIRVRFDSDTLGFNPLYKDYLHLTSAVELIEVRR